MKDWTFNQERHLGEQLDEYLDYLAEGFANDKAMRDPMIRRSVRDVRRAFDRLSLDLDGFRIQYGDGSGMNLHLMGIWNTKKEKKASHHRNRRKGRPD
jgi:hypothetical protein